MSYPVWPSELPNPERDSWQRQRQDGRFRRSGDVGPPMFRRRVSAVATTVGMSMILDRDQLALFDQFYDETAQGGAALFWMPDPTTEGWALLSETGAGLLVGDTPLTLSRRWLCSFGDEPPVETLIGVEFRVAFQVVVLP